MRRSLILVAAFAGLVVVPALAQNPPATTPVRVRGTIEKLDGNTLTVKSRDGQNLTIKLADNFGVSALVKKTIADVKSNDYIASTGVKGTDGKLHCIELRIFPEAQRGTAEGQFPWDSQADATMTNATVTGIVEATGGQTVKVKYKGTESDFVAGPECQVFGYVSGDAGLLKPGAAVFMVAQKKEDGTLTAARVTAEKDGVKPPM
ncbi:MAG TPA: hypothetical protein VFQ90_13855 [Stellaceae bacterium]|jgi:hypothetical protein|nr:hypothetical protein [Stellaceae bacterium]